MASKKFPFRDSEFNIHIQNTVAYLNANAARLLISGANLSQLATLKTNWDNCFPQSQDKNLRTASIVGHKNETRKALQSLLRSIFNDFPDSAIKTEDRHALKIGTRGGKVTPRPSITDIPMAGLTAKAGAVMSFIFRTETDSNRASMHPKADTVQLVYLIGDTPPASPDDCNKEIFSTKAKFDKRLNPADAGKTFYFYARWANLTNENKSGRWTVLMAATITG